MKLGAPAATEMVQGNMVSDKAGTDVAGKGSALPAALIMLFVSHGFAALMSMMVAVQVATIVKAVSALVPPPAYTWRAGERAKSSA